MSQQKHTGMSTIVKKQVKLLESTFNTAEAREVLLTLLDDKIRFHSNRIFGQEERMGVTPQDSVERIKQLRDTRQEIERIMNECKDQNCEIRIQSDINIEIR